MATLSELFDLYNDGDLIRRTSSALVIAAQALLDLPTPTAAQKQYAVKVFANPRQEAERVVKSILAQNSGATVAAIQGASDTQIQTNVDAAVQLFVDADAGV